MPLTSENRTIEEEGESKEAFTATFTNGAKQQLEDLKEYFNAPNLLEVIKLGITILERIRESEKGREVQKKDEQQPEPNK